MTIKAVELFNPYMQELEGDDFYLGKIYRTFTEVGMTYRIHPLGFVYIGHQVYQKCKSRGATLLCCSIAPFRKTALPLINLD